MSFESENGENIFREISAKSDIVKVVSYYLGAQALVRKGDVYMAICPFHNDSHPSMRVSPKRNTFKCFVCNTGGDSISFAEKYAHLSKLDALKKVCEICSIPLPTSLNHPTRTDTISAKYKDELEALKTLEKFYSLSLQSNEGEKGRNYLEGRKIPSDIIEHFGIGYAPKDPKDAINSLRKNGFEVSTLEKAGIIGNSAELKDRYQERIMFPIEDNYGKTVAFSGRLISPEQTGGKYINFPETDLFHKNEILYHYAKAKETVRRDGYIYLMEGFMDVIAATRAGINSVCGTMGTALTPRHVEALKSLDCEVRLCLDSDEPGQIGIERCLPLLLKAEIPMRVVGKFKGGKDADEVLTSLGEDELKKELNQLFDPFLFLLGRTLKGRQKLLDTLEIETFIKKSTPYFLSLSEVDKSRDLSLLSRKTTLSEQTLNKIVYAKENEKKPAEKTSYNKSGNKSGRDRYNKDFPEIPTKLPISENERLNEPALELKKAAMDRPEYSKAIEEKMIKNETEILLSLPLSRMAYNEFQGMRTVLVFQPFYLLASLVGNIYINDVRLKSFSQNEFDNMVREVMKEDDDKEKLEDIEDDAFGLDGLEDPLPSSFNSLSKEQKDFLLFTIKQMSLFKCQFDIKKFKKSLCAEKVFLKIYNFNLNLEIEKGGVPTGDDSLKKITLDAELSKYFP